MLELTSLMYKKRLITIRGAGGTGKTRLAMELAHALPNDLFPDGLLVIDLAPISDQGSIASTILTCLQFPQIATESQVETIHAGLSGSSLLLILDSCEHLLDACAAFVHTLLRRCAKVSVLATSREPLDIDGEFVYSVDPLPTSDFNDSASTNLRLADALRNSSAIRLFVDRAIDAAPQTFPASAENDAATIVRICRRLDGLPLALELAAARVRELSLRQISDGLDSRFELLGHGRRTAAPRHQTLRAMLDWSHALLKQDEKQLFRRLGIFAGSWRLDAALSICTDSDAAGIAALVSKSLVSIDEYESDFVRYRLLDSSRAYARELLAENDELDGLARRHAGYYRAQALHAEALSRTGYANDANEAFADLLADLNEVRAALDWCIGEQHDIRLGAELTGVLTELWADFGLHAEGLQRIREAEKAIGGDPTIALAAPLEFGAARILANLEHETALEHAARADDLTTNGAADIEQLWRTIFTKERRFTKGELIFAKGDPADDLFYIVSGTVFLSEFSQRVVKQELLGEVAFFSPRKQRTASAVCETDVTALFLSKPEVTALYESEPRFRLYLLQVFTKRMLQDLERLQADR